MATIKEQRAARRWGIFFKIFIGIYIFFATYLTVMSNPEVNKMLHSEPFLAVIDVKGIIAESKIASAQYLNKSLQDAFRNNMCKGVILRINSPGGSPTQTSLIQKKMDRLRTAYPEKKIYSVIEDVGASGAYWLAASSDKIFADKTSVVGSIGVITSSFGFNKLLDKYGIERRVYTAGKSKSTLDPFKPENPQEVAKLKSQLDGMHNIFIDVVKKGRAGKLLNTPDMFSGRIWIGYEAKDIGIIDEFGDVIDASKDFGVSKLIDFSPIEPGLAKFRQLIGQKYQSLNLFRYLNDFIG